MTINNFAQNVLNQLSQSLEQLATAVDDRPHLAAALRYERTQLPAHDEAPRARTPTPVRELLYSALAEGQLDYRRFDVLMLRTRRATRLVKAKRRRRAA